MVDQPKWEMPSGDWVQDDEKKRFFILNRETGELRRNQAGLEVIEGARHHPAGESECGGFFPSDFEHCPFCGTGLSSGEYHSDAWVPPFGCGSGLRLVSKRIDIASIPLKKEYNVRLVDQEKETFPLPRPRGDFEFIVASLGTRSPVLLAFDRITGSIDYYSPADEKWKSFAATPGRRVGESQLPNWGWSAASINGNAGFAVPTREAPVWIALDWGDGTCTPVFGQGESVGGVASMERQVVVPVLSGGALSIQGFDVAGLKWEPKGEPARGWAEGGGKDRIFSVPIVDEGRHIIYWVGVHGLLVFNLTDCSSVWRPWETDAFPCGAVPELGPPYRDTYGNFWQICYDDHDDSKGDRAFRYYKLHGTEDEREDVDGGRFSSGVSCFSKPYDLWEEPWARIDKRQDQAKMLRVPLLCLGEESKATITACFGSGSISPLLEIVRDREKTYQVDFRIESPGDLPVELRTRNAFNVNAPWELRLFIYRQFLHAYSIKEAVCYKWRLK